MKNSTTTKKITRAFKKLFKKHQIFRKKLQKFTKKSKNKKKPKNAFFRTSKVSHFLRYLFPDKRHTLVGAESAISGVKLLRGTHSPSLSAVTHTKNTQKPCFSRFLPFFRVFGPFLMFFRCFFVTNISRRFFSSTTHQHIKKLFAESFFSFTPHQKFFNFWKDFRNFHERFIFLLTRVRKKSQITKKPKRFFMWDVYHQTNAWARSRMEKNPTKDFYERRRDVSFSCVQIWGS